MHHLPRLSCPPRFRSGSRPRLSRWGDTDIALSVITSGDFDRQSNGSKGQTVTITGADDLTIFGGTFSNASATNPVRDGGVVISPRGYNIGLVEKVQANGDPAIPTGGGTYDCYAEEDIKAISWTSDADLIRFSAHASMPFDLTFAFVVPYIGLEWTRVSQDGYDDGLGREVDSIDEDALTMPIGVRFVKTVGNGATFFKGTMDVAYARDLTGFDPHLTTSYEGVGLDFESADIGKDAFRFGLGVDCHLSDAWTIGAKYKMEVRDNFTDNQVQATVNFAF